MYNPEVLRQARLAGGFTLREVGDSADLDPSAIAAYEKRRANPSVGAMNRWESALETLLVARALAVEVATVGLKRQAS